MMMQANTAPMAMRISNFDGAALSRAKFIKMTT